MLWNDKTTCLFGFKNESGNWVIPAIYQYASDFDYHTHLAIVEKDNQWGLIDTLGRLRGSMINDEIIENSIGPPSYMNGKEGYFRIKNGERYGLIDTMGNIVVKPRFDNFWWYYEGFLGLYPGFGDTTGKRLSSLGYVHYIGNGVIIYETDTVFEDYPEEDDVPSYDREAYGMMDYSGKILVRPQYEEIKPFRNIFLVKDFKTHQIGLMDKDGKFLTPLIYNAFFTRNEEIDSSNENLVSLTTDYFETVLYDIKKKQFLFDGLKVASLFEGTSDYYVFQKGEKYGISRHDGTVLVPAQYNEISALNGHNLIIAKKNYHWGIIDTTGKILFPFKYDIISEIKDFWGKPARRAMYAVSSHFMLGVMDSSGKILLKPQFDFLQFKSTNDTDLCLLGIKSKKVFNIHISFTNNKTDITPFKTKSPIIMLGKDFFGKPLVMMLPWNLAAVKRKFLDKYLQYKPVSYIINHDGNVILGSEYRLDSLRPDKVVAFSDLFKTGVMDFSGRILVKPEYHTILSTSEYYELGSRWNDVNNPDNGSSYYYFNREYGSKLGVMDKDFNILIDSCYAISDFRHCWFVQKDSGGTWTMLDSTGKKLADGFEKPDRDFGTFTSVKINGKVHLLKKDGTPFSNSEYDTIIEQPYHYVIVRNGDKYGILKDNGKIILPCVYDKIEKFTDGYSKVNLKGKWGLIDSEGNFKIKPEYTLLANAPTDLSKIYKLVPQNNRDSLNCLQLKNSLKNKFWSYEDSIFVIPWYCGFYSPDKEPGTLKTIAFKNDTGYYQLLASFNNPKVMQCINNYIIDLYKGQGRIYKYPRRSKEILYASDLSAAYNIPGSMIGDSWADFCPYQQSELFVLSDRIIGIKTKSTCCAKTSGFYSSQIVYKYLLMFQDSISVINDTNLFDREAIVDTIARILTDRNKTESRFCSDNENSKYSNSFYRNYFNPYNFQFTPEGLVWSIYPNSNDVETVLLPYKELKRYINQNSPLWEYVKNKNYSGIKKP